MDRAWILVGMMGAGKSSVGRALRDLSGREFIDTDVLIEQRLGRTIPRIFALYGEPAFRDHETSVLKGLAPAPAIISTGGGIVLREENWTEFQRLGTTIYLDADAEVLEDRLRKSKRKRPLLETENWPERLKAILDSRRALYSKADVHVNVGHGDMEDVAKRIIALMEERR